jgi:hypothetical protein
MLPSCRSSGHPRTARRATGVAGSCTTNRRAELVASALRTSTVVSEPESGAKILVAVVNARFGPRSVVVFVSTARGVGENEVLHALPRTSSIISSVGPRSASHFSSTFACRCSSVRMTSSGRSGSILRYSPMSASGKW